MKSIRVSLVLCFLVLLAVSLGAVSALVYRTTRATLLEKKKARQDLLATQHNERVQDLRARLDRDLLSHARSLANLAQHAQSMSAWGAVPSLQPFGLAGLSAGGGPFGYVQAPFWINQWVGGFFNRVTPRLHEMLVMDIQFSEFPPLHAEDADDSSYFQVNTEWGSAWRSQSMGEHTLPFDPQVFPATEVLDWHFDDTQLAGGVRVRRVVLKAPSRFRWIPSRPPNQGSDRGRTGSNGNPGRSRTTPSRPASPAQADRTRMPQPPPPALYIQCASSIRQRDAAIRASRAALTEELEELDAESDQTLASLRGHLWLIGLATFGATALGGLWLVHLGLRPLKRLSEAVSEVSEKDFRLPLEETELPRELRPIAARLAQTLDLLQRAFAREKQAAADISHDLRTPLAALLTTTEVALRKTRTAEEYREILQDCRATGQQMNQLVERTLSLARLDAGADNLRSREVDVTALTEQCAAVVRPLAEARGLTLRIHGQGPVCAMVDPDKLREVLTNLLHNAIEYNQPDGSVDVKVERENGHLHLEVQDTGIGIPPEARAHIFERFYRADPSRRADGLHAGLGLAIVKGYVDLMGGTIQVESAVARGSRFSIQLPVR